MTFTLLVIFTFLFHLPFSAVAQSSSSNITVGASLTAAENSPSWLSPSGDFAFGFYSLDSKKELYLLAIWYDKIPTKTVVWYANGDSPAPRGSKVELTAARGLVLHGLQDDELWSSDSGSFFGTVSYGVMNDTGNLELLSGSAVKLWESFSDSDDSDTMLPSQSLERTQLLSSRQSMSNFSKGRFRIYLKPDGNLVLDTINLPTDNANDPYNESKTSNSPGAGLRLVFNESGYIYLLLDNEDRFPLTSRVGTSAKDFYYRATIDYDGVFTQYRHPKNSTGNEGWTAYWSFPDDICHSNAVTTGSGTCGYNSICRLGADKRPICGCPKGYYLHGPNGLYGNCIPNFTQSCAVDDRGSPEELYDFEEIINTAWPGPSYEVPKQFTEAQCRESCLQDCMCAVAVFGSGECRKKKLPLQNGRADNMWTTFVKIRKGDLPLPPQDPRYSPKPDLMNEKKSGQGKMILVVSVLLGASIFFNFILFIAVCLCSGKQIPRHHRVVVETNLRCFTYKELEEATNGFKEELGKGAFGIVFKGEIQMSTIVQVAVKKLNNVSQEGLEKEFKTEINAIGQTHHKNLVRLLGFCDDGVERALVYEFMGNGALASFLFGDLKPGWSQRTQIALGIARGLVYLHEECSKQIIHCDIKPQNILLDDYYNARISDFGLAKLLLLDQSHTHTAIRGTKGYVAPEWFRNLPITAKVDVYSFGVLLLEIICCRRSVEMELSDAEALLIDWAYDCYCEERLDSLVEFDAEALYDMDKVERFVMVAIWCIQEDPSLRPTMGNVTKMLEGVAEVLIPPCPCPFTITKSNN